MALIPPIFALFSDIFLSSSTAASVLSLLVESSNVINTNFELPFDTLLVISFGKNSIGTAVPVKSLILTTFETPSIFLILFSKVIISLSAIFSVMAIAKAPLWKSLVNIFWPLIVSISLGKYTKIS